MKSGWILPQYIHQSQNRRERFVLQKCCYYPSIHAKIMVGRMLSKMGWDFFLCIFLNISLSFGMQMYIQNIYKHMYCQMRMHYLYPCLISQFTKNLKKIKTHLCSQDVLKTICHLPVGRQYEPCILSGSWQIGLQPLYFPRFLELKQ